jgi:uncharacterized NAD(P)/FAD-binding protein YdhS
MLYIKTSPARTTFATYIRQHTSAYVSIRQHTSAYVSIRQHTSAYVSSARTASRQALPAPRTSAYVSIRQHTSAYVSIRQYMSQHTSAYVSIKTSPARAAYVTSLTARTDRLRIEISGTEVLQNLLLVVLKYYKCLR